MYAWTLAFPALLCAALAAIARPLTDPERRTRALDVGLAALAICTLVQLVPLPGLLVDQLSPAARATRARLTLAVPSALPLTIDSRSTLWAALVGCGTIVVFLAARRLLASGGIRVFIRGVSAIGLAVSAIGIAQDATAHGLMYWRRAPLQQGAPPFGPFVDRNAFATWALLAIPLCAGYLAAHTVVHHRQAPAGVRWSARLRDAFDARAVWLAGSIALMLVALIVTLSRSGISSLAVAVVLGAYLRGCRQQTRRVGSWTAAACAVVVVLAVARIDPILLGRRFAAARTSAADRFVIWRETIPIVRDFWLTGAGAGTYETAMLVYQRSSPGVRFNQAHNHYLQAAAEGGLLLGVPLAVVFWTFGGAAIRKIRDDRSGMYWVRAGALCGLTSVAAQSVWDTGLTAPANAILAAVSAAIVVHPRESPTEPRR